MMMKQILYFSLLIFLMSCVGSKDVLKKINGISYVASNEEIAESDVTPIVYLHANYVAIMPYGFVKNLDAPDIVYNSKKQWYGETLVGAKQYIQTLQQQNVNIMLKPQIWVWRGKYTGDIEMNSETDWKTLEVSYSKFILEYAQLAQDKDIEIFCIGTELEQFITQRPEYWNELIYKIKGLYKGKLTYAANWDEFKHTPFWEKLDFIGINAYFPISYNKTPSVEDCRTGWEKHKLLIQQVSKKLKKPILFTEYGYRSVYFTAKTPWKSERNITEVNLEGQANALEALFDEFWKEDWFAGGFLWKWHHNHDKAGGKNDSRFTPQNKPAEDIVRANYSNN